jgi:hypothetical protein
MELRGGGRVERRCSAPGADPAHEVDGRDRRLGQARAVRGACPDLPREHGAEGEIEMRQLVELGRSDASG